MPPISDAVKPHRRKGFWYLLRRVPAEFAAVDRRTLIQISTGIRIADDPKGIRAATEVFRLNNDLIQYWQNKRAGYDRDAELRYAQARARARQEGFRYGPAAEIAAKAPIEDVVKRIEALAFGARADHQPTVDAVLGGVDRPPIMLSQLLVHFERIKAADNANKSPNQIKRWRVPRQTALDSFIAFIGGDRAVDKLTAQDVMAYRDELREQMAKKRLAGDTAKKAIGRVATMYRALSDDMQLGLPDLFTGMKIGKVKSGQRKAYKADFIQTRLLADGALDGINAEARAIFYLLVETGLRPSEACALKRQHIHLDAPVPYIEVRPDGRDVKTDASIRDIPLVGVALIAMRKFPNGFPRYYDKALAVSMLINKALAARDLRPGGTSLYSLRHAFEDRLTAVGPPEKVIADFMGHERKRERYGDGLSLELKRDWLNRIVFDPPSRV